MSRESHAACSERIVDNDGVSIVDPLDEEERMPPLARPYAETLQLRMDAAGHCFCAHDLRDFAKSHVLGLELAVKRLDRAGPAQRESEYALKVQALARTRHNCPTVRKQSARVYERVYRHRVVECASICAI
jgi:hypothetical protein